MRARKSFLFTESSHVVKIKNTWLVLLSHFNLHSFAYLLVKFIIYLQKLFHALNMSRVGFKPGSKSDGSLLKFVKVFNYQTIQIKGLNLFAVQMTSYANLSHYMKSRNFSHRSDHRQIVLYLIGILTIYHLQWGSDCVHYFFPVSNRNRASEQQMI